MSGGETIETNWSAIVSLRTLVLLSIIHLDNLMTMSSDIFSTSSSGYHTKWRRGGNSPRNNKGKLMLRDNFFSFIEVYGNYNKFTVSRVNTLYPELNYTSLSTDTADVLIGAFPYVADFRPDEVLNKLKLQLYAELVDTDVNLAVAYAEKSATANLLKDTAGKLLRGARALKKGNFIDAARHLGLPRSGLRKDHTGKWRKTNFTRDEFSRKWLEFSYGWTPLYNDMYGSLVAADKAMAKKSNSVKKFTKQAAYKNSVKVKNDIWWGPHTVTDTYDLRVKLSCNVTITNPYVSTLTSLGLTNPLLVAWEVVPFSFVLDWFIPVGSWLTAQTPLLGVAVTDVYRTLFAVHERQKSASYFSLVEGVSKSMPASQEFPYGWYNSGTNTTTWSSSGCTHKSVMVSREPSDLVATFPKPQFPDSWEQALSALSLFHSFMSKAGRF